MKDPAFLFYSKDFYESTRLMLPNERACFLDLLMYQHQNGFIPLNLERVIMYCTGVDKATLEATLEAKFVKTDKGYYNRKLNEVMNSRAEYTDRQSDNGIIGQFFKKAKQVLPLNRYNEVKNHVYFTLGKDGLLSELKKQEATHEGVLEALLKHLANVNANGIVNEDVNTSFEKSEKLFLKTVCVDWQSSKDFQETYLAWVDSLWDNHKIDWNETQHLATMRELKLYPPEEGMTCVLKAIQGKYKKLYPQKANGKGQSFTKNAAEWAAQNDPNWKSR